MNDLVSIVMPSFNCSSFLKETIESVINQTYKNWELLFVDDCSTDNSLEIIKKYAQNDSRIKIFVNPTNSGAAYSRNIALENASGRWIAFLDSDDLWESTKLEKQVLFMEKNNYSFSYTNYKQIDVDSNELGVLITGPKKVTRYKMLRINYIGCLTVMYDQNITGKLKVNEAIKRRNDYALWLMVSRFSTCYLLNESLSKYRIRNNSISHSGLKKLIKSHYAMFRKSEKFGPILSLFFTLRNIFWGILKKAKYTKKY